MPKSKKDDTESSSYDSDSGPDDRIPPPAAKKSKKEGKSKSESAETEEKSKSVSVKNRGDSDSEGPWILEGLRQVRINEFRGRKSVDIREFYNKNGETLPGKKGISLTATQWLKLLEHAEEITAAMRNQ